MIAIKHPEDPRQRDCLVVAVETMELGGKLVPLSYCEQVVKNWRVTATHYLPIRWGHPRTAEDGRPTEAELRTALADANTLRRLTPDDLRDGGTLHEVCETVEDTLVVAGNNDLLIVTHAVWPGLETMVDSVESCLGTCLPPLTVVDTAVLEVARRAGRRPIGCQTHGEFYAQMPPYEGEAPDLRDCRPGLEWVDDPVLPGDHLYAVHTTYRIYREFTRLRLAARPRATRGAP